MSEWISVNDRFPEPYEEVLAWDKRDKDCYIALLTHTKKWAVPGYIGNDFIITHWMPLPKPPKED